MSDHTPCDICGTQGADLRAPANRHGEVRRRRRVMSGQPREPGYRVQDWTSTPWIGSRSSRAA